MAIASCQFAYYDELLNLKDILYVYGTNMPLWGVRILRIDSLEERSHFQRGPRLRKPRAWVRLIGGNFRGGEGPIFCVVAIFLCKNLNVIFYCSISSLKIHDVWKIFGLFIHFDHTPFKVFDQTMVTPVDRTTMYCSTSRGLQLMRKRMMI